MTTDLQHSGKKKVVADALSRVFTIVNQPIDWSTFATDQGTDLNIPLFATAITGLKIDHVMVAGHSIVCVSYPDCHVRYFRQHGSGPFLILYTAFLTQESRHSCASSFVTLCGITRRKTYPAWQELAWRVKNTPATRFRFLKRLLAILDMCMWTSWDLCLSPKFADIFLPWWIVGHVGQKQSK